jgi:hypothetical protein
MDGQVLPARPMLNGRRQAHYRGGRGILTSSAWLVFPGAPVGRLLDDDTGEFEARRDAQPVLRRWPRVRRDVRRRCSGRTISIARPMRLRRSSPGAAELVMMLTHSPEVTHFDSLADRVGVPVNPLAIF